MKDTVAGIVGEEGKAIKGKTEMAPLTCVFHTAIKREKEEKSKVKG